MSSKKTPPRLSNESCGDHIEHQALLPSRPAPELAPPSPHKKHHVYPPHICKPQDWPLQHRSSQPEGRISSHPRNVGAAGFIRLLVRPTPVKYHLLSNKLPRTEHCSETSPMETMSLVYLHHGRFSTVTAPSSSSESSIIKSLPGSSSIPSNT